MPISLQTPFGIEAQLHGSAGDRKIARHFFEFQINPGAAFVRQRENNLGQDFVRFAAQSYRRT